MRVIDLALLVVGLKLRFDDSGWEMLFLPWLLLPAGIVFGLLTAVLFLIPFSAPISVKREIAVTGNWIAFLALIWLVPVISDEWVLPPFARLLNKQGLSLSVCEFLSLPVLGAFVFLAVFRVRRTMREVYLLGMAT